MNRTACLIVFPRFSEYELSVAISVMAQGGVDTQVFSLSSDPVRGEAGLTLLPDGALEAAPRDGIDAVIVPGADDFGHLVDEVGLYAYLCEVVHTSPRAVIAGISAGTFVLAKAGLLAGHRYATPFPAQTREFLQVFPEEGLEPGPVVSDGRRLTAHGSAFMEFGMALGDLLGLTFDRTWYGIKDGA